MKAKIEGDLDKQWLWGGFGGGGAAEDAESRQDGYRRNSQEGKLENWKEKGLGGGEGLTRVEKIMALDWRLSEMVVNSCLEDLEERMRFKRMGN